MKIGCGQTLSLIVIIFAGVLSGHLEAAPSRKSGDRTLERPFGVGAEIGTTTGFTFKYVRDAKIAFDALLGWGGYDNFRLSGDMLWQKPRVFLVDREVFDGYYGLGGRIRDRGQHSHTSSNNGLEAGFRGVGGFRYLFNDPVAEVFAELALVLDFLPGTEAEFELGIGGRFFF